ncbi:MAG: WD40 repeat domain-containing protein [Gemmataceae bacterium]|nr:WD40 repeat domain-containing protein [Gemmataceae bacterium]
MHRLSLAALSGALCCLLPALLCEPAAPVVAWSPDHATTNRARVVGKPAVTALAIAPDGKGFVHGSQAGVALRPFTGGDEQRIPTKLDHVHALAFAPDGSTLAVAGGSPAESGVVELWSWPQRKLLGRLEGHADVVYDVVWLTGGKGLVTASADRTLRVWDGGTRKPIRTLTGHSGPVLALALAPDSKWLCSGSADQTIRVWKTDDWSLARSLDNHLGPVHSLAFRPGGEEGRPAYLASSGGDSTIRIWQPAIGRLVRIVRHPAPVLALGWSPDGKHLWTGSKDGVLRTVDADSDSVLAERKSAEGAVVSLAVHPVDGRLVIGDARGALALLDGGSLKRP